MTSTYEQFSSAWNDAVLAYSVKRGIACIPIDKKRQFMQKMVTVCGECWLPDRAIDADRTTWPEEIEKLLASSEKELIGLVPFVVINGSHPASEYSVGSLNLCIGTMSALGCNI